MDAFPLQGLSFHDSPCWCRGAVVTEVIASVRFDNGLARMSPRGQFGGVRLLPGRVLLLAQYGLRGEPEEGYFKLTAEGARRHRVLDRPDAGRSSSRDD